MTIYHCHWKKTEFLDYDRMYSVVPPSLVSLYFFTSPGDRAIFLNGNVQYNDILFVTGGVKHTGWAETE